MLNEGTLIAAPFDKHESAAADGDSIVAHNQSTRYPLVVTATVSRAAVFAEHADLRAIATAGGAVLALLIIALAVLIPLRGRSNPIVEMERALEAGEFVPYYQPLVDLRSGAVVGAEVLMRWRKADGSADPAGHVHSARRVLRPDPRNDQGADDRGARRARPGVRAAPARQARLQPDRASLHR